MCLKSLRLLPCLSLAFFFVGACSTAPSGEGTSSSSPATEETKMDPITSHEIYMLREAFPTGDYYEKYVLESLQALRAIGVGSIVSLEKIADEDIPGFDRKISVTFMLEIVDNTNEHFRVGFSRSGLAVTAYTSRQDDVIIMVYDDFFGQVDMRGW